MMVMNKNSTFVGLFWFEDNFSNIYLYKGMKEFDENCIGKEITIMPEGNHSDYIPSPGFKHRGRVMLLGGKIVVYVGTKCPEKALDMVLTAFGLFNYKHKKDERYNDDLMKIHRTYDWDKKKPNKKMLEILKSKDKTS
jgi:hypothetical protein